ncbi:alpha/beta fold hydrolase [Plastoroseomonas arctica]|uniref:Alpha/beta hydrolase n=1 Tax=Plastoroseomonas arctica TaxID=1509237 RepID=A0AAF1JZP2_9PROT|nr:alpha/beta fold hydrolase [Plastoroseomonas arctica]MBR0656995.1 alpha/beta hydrolase [Plastoroseomonas arctica]
MNRRTLLAALPALSACTPVVLPMGPPRTQPMVEGEVLVMADGARLPLRSWLPEDAPRAVVLGLHGFNEYARSFLADPAPLFNARGVALYGIDQRGFGAAPNRGYWAGHETLAADATTACALLRARHPGVPLVLMGESMGGSVAMLAATGPTPLAADALVLLAPAVWGRNTMSGALRFALSLAAVTLPAAILSGGVAGVVPTDNQASLIRWSRDPLILRQTRVDAALGLVDLMDAAVAAAPRLGADGKPALILYGGRDLLVPPEPTRAVLDTLDPAAPVMVGFYPTGFHQLLRDRGGAAVAEDVLAWLQAPYAALPSGAREAGIAWRTQAS